jgi:ATP-dependent Clp protease ATP-binding subunit ClpB
MTSNLGASEMNSIMRPHLGFAASEMERKCAEGVSDAALSGKVSRTGIEAARKKFTPEFMNRIDKVVVFRPLGEEELRQILTLELNLLQQRIMNSAHGAPFVFSVTEPAQDYLLREGTDMKYGARHLKRAIDRSVVHPISNLIATAQVKGGDLIKIDYDEDAGRMVFSREAEDLPQYAMMQMVDLAGCPPLAASATSAVAPPPARVANARGSRR